MQAIKTQQVIRISLLLFGMYALLSARIFHVQFSPDEDVVKMQATKETRSFWLEGKDFYEIGPRGAILDRNSRLLAGSFVTFELICDPHADYRPPPRQKVHYALFERLEFLSAMLFDLGIEHDRDALLEKGTQEYRWVEQDDGTTIARKNRGLELLDGILSHQRAYMSRVLVSRGIQNFSFPPESRRDYPQGELIEDIVGKVGWIGAENETPRFQGKSGLELAFDEILTGKTGRFVCEKDGRGREFDVDGYWRSRPEDGWNLRTSLDLRIQSIADRALREAIEKFPCKSGCALVLDSQSGEILAVVGRNKDGKKPRQGAIALTEAREPGSTIKPLIVAKALEGGFVSWADRFDTNGGFKVLQRGRLKRGVHDSSPHQVLDLAEVVIVSSNIGMAMIGVEKMGFEALVRALSELRFTELPDLHFPAMARTNIDDTDNRLNRTVSPTFGHGISMSPLALLTAMNVFATSGMRHDPLLLLDAEREDEIVASERRSSRLIPAEIADRMLLTMERVVEEGTGKVLRDMPWRVAAKTGTAQAIPYGNGKYHSSMIAIAPVSQPRLTIYVGLYDVHGGTIYGGSVAGPVIKTILEESLPMLGVAPDKEKR